MRFPILLWKIFLLLPVLASAINYEEGNSGNQTISPSQKTSPPEDRKETGSSYQTPSGGVSISFPIPKKPKLEPQPVGKQVPPIEKESEEEQTRNIQALQDQIEEHYKKPKLQDFKKSEAFRVDEVFHSKKGKTDCLLQPGPRISLRKSVAPSVLLEQVGRVNHKDDNLDEESCLLKDMIRYEFNPQDFRCEKNTSYLIIDQSLSMKDDMDTLFKIIKQLYRDSATKPNRLVVMRDTDQEQPPIIDSSTFEGDISMLEDSIKQLTDKQRSEQGFKTALNTLFKYPPLGQNHCVHFIFFSDEEEQSPLSIEQFSRLARRACNNCKNIFGHSFFTPRCSKYAKFGRKTTAIHFPSKLRSNFRNDPQKMIEYVKKLSDPTRIQPIGLPIAAYLVLSVEELGEETNQLDAKGEKWVFYPELNAIEATPGTEASLVRPVVVKYLEKTMSESEIEECK